MQLANSKPNSTLRRFVRVALLVALAATIGSLASTAWACPTCREGLADSPQARGLASGLYYSIIFMMSMPFLILGAIGTVFYRSVRRAQAEKDAAAVAEGVVDASSTS